MITMHEAITAAAAHSQPLNMRSVVICIKDEHGVSYAAAATCDVHPKTGEVVLIIEKG